MHNTPTPIRMSRSVSKPGNHIRGIIVNGGPHIRQRPVRARYQFRYRFAHVFACFEGRLVWLLMLSLEFSRCSAQSCVDFPTGFAMVNIDGGGRKAPPRLAGFSRSTPVASAAAARSFSQLAAGFRSVSGWSHAKVRAKRRKDIAFVVEERKQHHYTIIICSHSFWLLAAAVDPRLKSQNWLLRLAFTLLYSLFFVSSSHWFPSTIISLPSG